MSSLFVCCISYVHIQYHAYMYNTHTASYSTCTVSPVNVSMPCTGGLCCIVCCMHMHTYVCVCVLCYYGCCLSVCLSVYPSVVTAVQQELRLIKSEISQQCRQNYELERDVRMYDSKIAHLINHRITLEASYSPYLSGCPYLSAAYLRTYIRTYVCI